MNARLELDKKYWQDKAADMDAKKNEQASEIIEALEKLQQSIANSLFPAPIPAFDLAKYPIRDLARFGQENAANDYDFRWPSIEQLQALNLTKPPKLTEIKTIGISGDDGLCSIQLIFEGGIQSPLIDAKSAKATTQVNSYQVKNKTISSLYARVWSSDRIEKLDFTYQDG